jgi:arylsulfatase A-like enzyme
MPAHWFRLSAAGAVAVGGVELVLIERRFGVFAGGFLNSESLSRPIQQVAFIAGSLITDFACVGLGVALGLLIASRARLAAAATRCLALMLGCLPLLAYDAASYRVLHHLGDMFDVGLMFDLVGKRPSEFFAVAAAHAAAPVAILVAAILAAGVLVRTLHVRYPGGQRLAPPPLWFLGAALAAAAGLVTVVHLVSDTTAQALRRKPSAYLLAFVMAKATDLDRDGLGLLSRPADFAPFDARRHPYALDVPANGIDENGLAGDLPQQAPSVGGDARAAERWTHRPDFLLILLESVRADVVGATLDGRAVTPVLDRLAQQGARASYAYSHTGFTHHSRLQLLTGCLASANGSETLLDDFRRNGYQIGYFSGQDDSFGGHDPARWLHPGDVFFDARQAASQRYSRFSTAGSLAVPSSVVEGRVSEFLHRTNRQGPVFIYLNLHDTHFPYQHGEMAPLVSDTVLEQSAISRERAADLRRMYLNAVANADAAIGRVIGEVERIRGHAPAVLITSDHGESLYDDGLLGHGFSLNSQQTQVPFVVANLPIRIEEPFGLVDVRRAVREALATESNTRTASFRPAEGRSLLQFLGSLEEPRQISLRTIAGQSTFDFRTGRVSILTGEWKRPAELTGLDLEAFRTLIHRWEAERLAQAAAATR